MARKLTVMAAMFIFLMTGNFWWSLVEYVMNVNSYYGNQQPCIVYTYIIGHVNHQLIVHILFPSVIYHEFCRHDFILKVKWQEGL